MKMNKKIEKIIELSDRYKKSKKEFDKIRKECNSIRTVIERDKKTIVAFLNKYPTETKVWFGGGKKRSGDMPSVSHSLTITPSMALELWEKECVIREQELVDVMDEINNYGDEAR